ncbi:MAG: PQQ-binding-like beta-propeller repeat protein [Bacteroidota bacterium]
MIDNNSPTGPRLRHLWSPIWLGIFASLLLVQCKSTAPTTVPGQLQSIDLGLADEFVDLYECGGHLIVDAVGTLIAVDPERYAVTWQRDVPSMHRVIGTGAHLYHAKDARHLEALDPADGEIAWEWSGYFPQNAQSVFAERQCWIAQDHKITRLGTRNGEVTGTFDFARGEDEREYFIGIGRNEHTLRSFTRGGKDSLACYRWGKVTPIWAQALPQSPVGLTGFTQLENGTVGYADPSARRYILRDGADGRIRQETAYGGPFLPQLLSAEQLLYISPEGQLSSYNPRTEVIDWTTPLRAALRFPPQVSEKYILAVISPETVAVISRKSGAVLERIKFPVDINSAPIYLAQRVHVLGKNGVLCAKTVRSTAK